MGGVHQSGGKVQGMREQPSHQDWRSEPVFGSSFISERKGLDLEAGNELSFPFAEAAEPRFVSKNGGPIKVADHAKTGAAG